MPTHLSCSYFEKNLCTSCVLLSRKDPYAAKKDFVEGILRKAFPSVTHIEPLAVEAAPFYKRHKAKFLIFQKEKVLRFGILRNDKSEIPLEECPLHTEAIQNMLPGLAELLTKARVSAYDIERQKGEGKAVLILSNQDDSELLVRVVLRSTESVPRIRKALPEFLQNHSSVRVFSVNIQPIPAAILEGEEEIVLTERSEIEIRYPTGRFFFAPQSFMQVSYDAASALYQKAKDWISLTPVSSAVDLYCGVGGFLLSIRDAVTQGVGVEVSSSAITCAQKSAGLLGASHLQFVAKPVEDFLQNGDIVADLVIVNPPRRGLSQEICQSMISSKASRILYSSCSFESFLRDYKVLKEIYSIEKLAPFDMFPLTEHFELLALLKR